jgi:hypothetical protein
MIKRIPLLYFLCVLFLSPIGVWAQTPNENTGPAEPATETTDVAVMTFLGDDLSASEVLHDATVEEVKNTSFYNPVLIGPDQYSEVLTFLPDEPPDPMYLGSTKYVLTGEFYVDDEGMQHFQLWLWKSGDGALVYTDELVAEDLDEALSYMPALVAWVFSRIPEERKVTVVEKQPELTVRAVVDDSGNRGGSRNGSGDGPVNDPLNRWWYLGLRFGGSVRSYVLPRRDDRLTSNYTQGVSFEAAFQAGWRFLPFLSVQAELIFTQDEALFRVPEPIQNGTSYQFISYSDSYRSTSLMLPVLLKFHIRRDPFLISPIAGLYFAIPVGQMEYDNAMDNEVGTYDYTINPGLGIVVGLDVGIEMGPGIMFLDVRYGGDMGITSASVERNGEYGNMRYTRSMFSFSLGYELALANKKPRIKTE